MNSNEINNTFSNEIKKLMMPRNGYTVLQRLEMRLESIGAELDCLSLELKDLRKIKRRMMEDGSWQAQMMMMVTTTVAQVVAKNILKKSKAYNALCLKADALEEVLECERNGLHVRK